MNVTVLINFESVPQNSKTKQKLSHHVTLLNCMQISMEITLLYTNLTLMMMTSKCSDESKLRQRRIFLANSFLVGLARCSAVYSPVDWQNSFSCNLTFFLQTFFLQITFRILKLFSITPYESDQRFRNA